MIECIFTLDYEIYGNGEGSLQQLVYEPTQKLIDIFEKFNKRFVAFIEVAELEKIEDCQSDDTIEKIRSQIRELHQRGFEIGLHLHPQWYNARYEDGRWFLDYKEYNLCTLPEKRIAQIIDHAIAHLRTILCIPDFIPFSFRSGHLLFQPTRNVANVLAARGIKVDSSVYKGGLWHQHKLDYRPAQRNGYYWKFKDSINISDPQGKILELPIYTQMVPSWTMLSSKRIGLQKKGGASTAQIGKKILYRFMDFLRFRYPLKFDFCSMTVNELTDMVDKVIREDQQYPTTLKPIVAIGHTKDFEGSVDFETVEYLLSYLEQKGIEISTIEKVYGRCK